MSDFYYLDENKNAVPCDPNKWAKQLDEMLENNTKHVGYFEVEGNRISTVWLGLDHEWRPGNRPPLIFETMVFDEKGHDCYCERYSTWQEAEEGHKRAIKWAMDGCKEEDRK